MALPFVEHRELDQGQHDGLRDVFAVPGACTLVRAGPFAEVGGFDEGIDFLGDDLSLCWRIRVAGGRVLVTSGARVRHGEAFASRPSGEDAAALAARHRVRALLTSYRAGSLVTIVPLALLVSVAQALWALVTGRAGLARAALGAWPWNLARLGSLSDARRAVASFRRVRDYDVRRHMVPGLVGPRVQRLRVEGAGVLPGGRRPSAGAGSRPCPSGATWTSTPPPGRRPRPRWPRCWPGSWCSAAATWSRGSCRWWASWCRWAGTRSGRGRRGCGRRASPGTPGRGRRAWPAGPGCWARCCTGHLALARTVLTVGLIPLGVVGAHRLGDGLGSKVAQVAGAVAYAAVPLPYDALAAGRWSALGAYAAAPWMLRRLALASGTAPFGPDGGRGVWRPRLVHHAVATGAVTALAGLLVPQAPVVLLVMGAALALGTLAGLEVRGLVPLAVATVGGAAVAGLLLLPTTLDVLGSGGAFESWLGVSGGDRGMSALDVAGLRTGEAGLAPATFALAGAALVPLLVGRRWRLGWALRAWALALVCAGVVWAGEQGHLGMPLPDPGVLLAVAAAGLALAVALGVAAVGGGRAGPVVAVRAAAAGGGAGRAGARGVDGLAGPGRGRRPVGDAEDRLRQRAALGRRGHDGGVVARAVGRRPGGAAGRGGLGAARAAVVLDLDRIDSGRRRPAARHRRRPGHRPPPGPAERPGGPHDPARGAPGPVRRRVRRGADDPGPR